MGLMPGGIFRAQYPCAIHGVSVDDSIASIERIFKNDAEPRDIAAIIVEPVQGEGGFNVAPKDFMARLRALCDEHGILLIADEVQTGAGRTGTFFAMEQMGVVADLTTFAKSVGGGFPIAGVCAAEIMDVIAPGGLGGTYAGNPLVLRGGAGGHGNLRGGASARPLQGGGGEAHRRPQGDPGQAQGDRRGTRPRGDDRHRAVRGWRPGATGRGADVADRRPGAGQGLILLSCGTYYNVLRVLVPLTVEDELLERGLAILGECFDELT